MATKRPQTLSMAQWKPVQVALLRRTFADKIDKDAEKRYANEKLQPAPERVSMTSSTHPVFEEIGTENPPPDVDMMSGVKGDLVNMVIMSVR